MPRNGSGTYSLPQPAFVAGTVISSAAINSDLSDIGIALTGSLPRDGQAGMTGQFKASDGSAISPSISFSNEVNSGFFHAASNILGIVINGVQVGSIGVSGVSGAVPVGSIINFGGTAAPTQWLLCYGQAVSRATYAALFVVIGTLFGSGDGSTTFNLPDLRGSILAGNDAMGGVAASRLTTAVFGSDPTIVGNRGGIQSKTLLTANLPAYTPTGSVPTSNPAHNHGLSATGTSSTFQTSNTGGGVNVPNPGGGTIDPAGTSVTASFSGTPQGGSSTAFGLIQPSLIVNKIIFAGV